MISFDVLVGYEVRRCVESEPRINKFGFSEKQCSLGTSTNDILKHARLNRGIYRTIVGLLLVKAALGEGFNCEDSWPL